MKPFLIIPDRNKRNTFARPAPDYVEAVVLVANTNQAITIPAAAVGGFVVFSCDGDFYAKPGATAAVPSATTTDGSASEMNPKIWNIDGLTQIAFIAVAAQKLTLSFYAP